MVFVINYCPEAVLSIINIISVLIIFVNLQHDLGTNQFSVNSFSGDIDVYVDR